MLLKVHHTLAEIPADSWARLTGTDTPFLKHEFLNALETTGCVNPKTGWSPRHLGLYQQTGNSETLIGAVPLYLKTHSYGEYIFDWAWANAYDKAGLNYYPKLSAAVPFTPVTGPRLLVANNHNKQDISQQLIVAALDLAKQEQASSLHWLFVTSDEIPLLEAEHHLSRNSFQFHWQNNGYGNFDEFLAGLSSGKRKKIKRERRQVAEEGISVKVVPGSELSREHWDSFYSFYYATIQNHWAIPYLNREFFYSIGQTMPENIVMILAFKNNEVIAGALNFRDDNCLYGRYWGSNGMYHSLHFETCYYRAIEYCIENGLQRFEAGAQGEHKLSRGFLPTPVYSAHWLDHAEFNRAVSDFIDREKHGISHQIAELNDHSPFKQVG
ncbi:MAG: GNAT family N-acetyltransferase [Gammaproteobacteria bacterium]|nr:GNAT family N-acetyltransferase [Gammaproteobacteria bacterium]